MNTLTPYLRGLHVRPSTTTVAEAAKAMERLHVGSLVVLEEGVPRGLVTDRDLALHALLDGDAGDPLSACMSSPLLEIPVGATVRDAAHAMRRHAVRRLAVRDTDGTLAGFVSADDLLLELGSLLGRLAATVQREFDKEHRPTGHQPLMGKE